MQNAASWPNIDAERGNLPPNRCRAQQVGPTSTQSAAIRRYVDAERRTLPRNGATLPQKRGTSPVLRCVTRSASPRAWPSTRCGATRGASTPPGARGTGGRRPPGNSRRRSPPPRGTLEYERSASIWGQFIFLRSRPRRSRRGRRTNEERRVTRVPDMAETDHSLSLKNKCCVLLRLGANLVRTAWIFEPHCCIQP